MCSTQLQDQVDDALDKERGLSVFTTGSSGVLRVPANMEVIVLSTRRLEQFVGTGSLAMLNRVFAPASAGARPFGEVVVGQ